MRTNTRPLLQLIVWPLIRTGRLIGTGRLNGHYFKFGVKRCSFNGFVDIHVINSTQPPKFIWQFWSPIQALSYEGDA